MAAHRGPCLPPLSCHPGVELIVLGVAPGLHFPPTGLVLGPLRRLHHQHQLEMASKILHVKMSGKADSSSTRFLICHLQSHMYQQPKVTPVNWQETRAAVAPTEENGVPHHFLPSQGDLCLLFSTQAQELLLLLLYENCTHPPSHFSSLVPFTLGKKGK